jgi:hypothetical protein
MTAPEWRIHFAAWFQLSRRHVWTAPFAQGFSSGIGIPVWSSHVFGLLSAAHDRWPRWVSRVWLQALRRVLVDAMTVRISQTQVLTFCRRFEWLLAQPFSGSLSAGETLQPVDAIMRRQAPDARSRAPR